MEARNTLPSNLLFSWKDKTMLVLSRKESESLVIGEDVVITVNRISGNRITLGIEAPRHVRIVRGELDRQDASAADAPRKDTSHGASGEVAERQITYLKFDRSLLESDPALDRAIS
jgi:carbon storage regulator